MPLGKYLIPFQVALRKKEGYGTIITYPQVTFKRELKIEDNQI